MLVSLGLTMAGEPLHEASSSASPTLDLVMPGARPRQDDDYLCSAFDVMELSQAANNATELHITGIRPIFKEFSGWYETVLFIEFDPEN